ncbi:uncharacterized protein [Narcine bancroftii]|uniref:uncharacterized protein isoform X3 n=1 Tax=Narcine bancroftii TaxID=1343680 RepID=UPI003831EA0B
MDVMVHFEMNKLRRLGPVPQSDECSWLYEEVFSEREKRELSERKLVFKIFRIRATFMSARAKAPGNAIRVKQIWFTQLFPILLPNGIIRRVITNEVHPINELGLRGSALES